MKKRILLKLTGQLFIDPQTGKPSGALAHSILDQIKRLEPELSISIVVGGGNFFRGRTHQEAYGLSAAAAHEVGMMATVMNGLMLTHLARNHGLDPLHLSAITCSLAENISKRSIQEGLSNNRLIIFSGGTGAPFFTTDTNAIIRALSIGAHCIWKGTNVAGVYTDDPHTNSNAVLLETVSYQTALDTKLKIMDDTAYVLGKQHNIPTLVFDIHKPNALMYAARTDAQQYGTLIT